MIQSRGAALLAFIVAALLTLALTARLLSGPTVDAALLTGRTSGLSGSRAAADSAVALALREVQSDASWSRFNAAEAAANGSWHLSWVPAQPIGGATALNATLSLTNSPSTAIITAPDGVVAMPGQSDTLDVPSGVPLAFSALLQDGESPQPLPVATAGLTLTWSCTVVSGQTNGTASLTQQGLFTGTASSQSLQAQVSVSATSAVTGQAWPLATSPVLVTVEPASGPAPAPAPTSGSCGSAPGPTPGADDQSGCWENIMTLAVTSQPTVTGQSGQATVTGIPVGTTQCGSGTSASGPIDITWVDLFWAPAGQDDTTAVQVGTCAVPSAGQTTCTFVISTAGQGYLFAGGDSDKQKGNWSDDNNNDGESYDVPFTVASPS